jgi:16S rRNA (adenine1518-N6/adenine1519-N6)-dimethyltransferase
MKLSEMKEILAAGNIRLTKSLGQNFLHDGNQLRRIIEVAELTRSDKVLEIGSGLGPLTELLVHAADEVLAIEKDARLVQVLKTRFAPLLSGTTSAGAATQDRFQLVHDDALEYLRREPRDWSDWKLVANLPYSVASPILVELAHKTPGPQRMVATLQIEVARRLMARAGQDDYGILTLLVQLHYEPKGWFKIPASCFFPAPEIDSACVCLDRRSQPLLAPHQIQVFGAIVKRSFSQRRKGMLKLLKLDWPADLLDRIFAELALSHYTRAETVSLEQFVVLAQTLGAGIPAPHTKALPCATHPIEEFFDVVNDRDEVVGRQTRAEVHRRGLMHRAVHVLVFNSQGQVFLQKRSMKKDRQPGLWDSSASGHVDSGEDYAACALRELREEIGLCPSDPPRALFKLPGSPETDQEHVWVYRCDAAGPLTPDPEEIERGGWFAPEEVTRWIAERPNEFATALRVIWPRVNRAQTRLTSGDSQA